MYISSGNIRNTDQSVFSAVDSTGIEKTPENKIQPPLSAERITQLKQLFDAYPGVL
jgi:hypothetical protein